MSTAVNPHCFDQSASSIKAFRSCPTLFRLGYREGLRPAEDTESQRQGTNWHGIHEVYANALGPFKTAETAGADPEEQHNVALQAVIEHLNKRYEHCPLSIDIKDWTLERAILLTSFIGYQWYWAADPVEFLASEVPFTLPINVPRVNMPLPLDEVRRRGKIDHIVRWQGFVGALERKSTTRNIDPSGPYWDKSKKDVQVSMYALAFRDMRKSGKVPFTLEEDAKFGGTLYDVWCKPKIKPAMLTQKETAEFIVSGDYCGQQFEVKNENPNNVVIIVNGETCDIEPGKKGFAVRETVEMFSARLLLDIQARPDHYFQRREITRTDRELDKFAIDGYNIYQSQRYMDKTGQWYENEDHCNDPFPCAYKSICYGVGADAVCDGKTTPAGFRRIFVDITVGGKEVD